MNKKKYKYIYGPVSSWRLGRSLGVDPLSARNKICTFDCVYCQLGKTKNFSDKRKVFIPVKNIMREINSLPAVAIDYITFSGAGEPTLAANLGEMIRSVKAVRKEKVAVITNSSLLNRKDVQQDLLAADYVIAKLDGLNTETANIMNRPMSSIDFNKVIKGIISFKNKFKGRLALQSMFIKDNKLYAKAIARLARKINPDEIQINTPLRACAVKPLNSKVLLKIKKIFIDECPKNIKIFTVYEAEKIKSKSISGKDTLRRRGK